jgi:transposase
MVRSAYGSQKRQANLYPLNMGTKRGRKRLFNAAIHALRTRVDRTFAWEDKFKRLLLRFEHIQQRHFGMKLMAYTLINVREFCGA